MGQRFLKSIYFVFRPLFQPKIAFLICFFITFESFAEDRLCRFFFNTSRPHTDQEKLNTAFEQGTQRILQVVPLHSISYSTLANFLKIRISQSIEPSVSVVVVENNISESNVKTPFEDLQNTVAIETVFYKTDLRPILEERAQSKILIVSANQSAVVFTQLRKYIEENPDFSIEGIYIDQRGIAISSFSQERLDDILQVSNAILYGVASGSPSGLRRIFTHYEKAFALGEVLEFSQVTLAHTTWFSYEQTQKLAIADGIASSAALREWKRPPGVPVDIKHTYQNRGWTSVEDFLGISSRIKNQEQNHQPTLDEVREVVREKKFWVPKQYTFWSERPTNFPARPDKAYEKSGWKGWDDFLGQTKWMTYEEAQKAVLDAEINNWQQFENWRERPQRLPPYPDKIYEEWTSAADFFKNPKIRKGPTTIQILTYPEAEKVAATWAREKGITKLTIDDYQARKDRPTGLPYEPQRYYKGKGWIDMDTFLGLKNRPDIKLLNVTSESQSPDQWAAQ